MRGDRRKDGLRRGTARVCRYPPAYNELIGRTGVKVRLSGKAGINGDHIRRRRASAAAKTCRHIRLQLTEAAGAARPGLYRTTVAVRDPRGAGQHGHGHPKETQPDGQNRCQPTHHSLPPLCHRYNCVDARPRCKFSQSSAGGGVKRRDLSLVVLSKPSRGRYSSHGGERRVCSRQAIALANVTRTNLFLLCRSLCTNRRIERSP
jgi:hypothetical protein